MRVGGEYRLEALAGRHWARLADAVGLDSGALLARVEELATQAPAVFATAAEHPDVKELVSELPSRLADLIATRSARCRQALTS